MFSEKCYVSLFRLHLNDQINQFALNHKIYLEKAFHLEKTFIFLHSSHTVKTGKKQI